MDRWNSPSSRDDFQSQWRDIIIRELVERNMTQVTLSHLCGVSQPHLCSFLSGKKKAGLVVMMRILRPLGLTLTIVKQ